MSIDPDLKTLAQHLTAATRAGKMADAYGIVQGIPYRDLPAVALQAGYACISHTHKRDFIAHLVSQVAEASRRKTDGWGLRGASAPEAAD